MKTEKMKLWDWELTQLYKKAADKHGHRLGYGGGYYDRFLLKTNAIKAILCYNDRLFDRIFSQKHDIACDIIFTEGKVIDLS